MTTLPLEKLTWEEFQAFCCALIQNLPDFDPLSCHQYGVPGDDQEGIDISACKRDGTTFGFQCKREKAFGPAKVIKAIEEATFKADKYVILLSRTATAFARKKVAEFENWDIWDIEDISQRVRNNAEREHAYILVRDYFGGETAEAFLSVKGLSAFLTSQQFFNGLDNSTSLFHHNWLLVGRQNHLQRLNEFVDSEGLQVVILHGRGGIGKSKILYAFAAEIATKKDWKLRFINTDLLMSFEGFNSLGLGSYIFVIDDAHRVEDSILRSVISAVQQRQAPTKLLLSTRPQSVEHIQTLLTLAGFNRESIFKSEIKDLDREDVRLLGQQALGEGKHHLIEPLASATYDCPLITVIGGQLLAQGKVDLALLTSNEDFRYSVLNRFGDEFLVRLEKDIDRASCRRLLHLIAATSPLRHQDEDFLEACAEFLQVDSEELHRCLDIFEKSGILIRRGRLMRLVPDVLSDYILHQACLNSKEEPTGYANKVFREFASISPTEVLRNLSELDWRMRRKTGIASHLLDSIWQDIEEEFRTAPYSGRFHILSVLKPVAAYQPAPILRIVEYAMRNPAVQGDDPMLTRYYNHGSILRELPELLGLIAYNLEYRRRCTDLLWQLGRSDSRALNPYPDHAIRILQDMAGYEIGKPYAASEVVVDAVAGWLKEPDAHKYTYSVLEILDQVLKKEGHSNRANSIGIELIPFAVSVEQTEELRRKALALVRDCGISGKPAVCVRAIKSLQYALSLPYGLFGRPVSDEEVKQWLPEQTLVISILSELVKATSNPLLHLHILESVDFSKEHSPFPEIREFCESLVTSIPDTFEFRLYRVLTGKLGHPRRVDDMTADESHQAYLEHEEQTSQFIANIASEFLQRYPNPEEGLSALVACMEHIWEVGDHFHYHLLTEIAKKQCDYAAQICDIICEKPVCSLSNVFGSLLQQVRLQNNDRAFDIMNKAIQTQEPVLCRGVASIYQGWNWATYGKERDVNTLFHLSSNTDLQVRLIVLNSMIWLMGNQPEQAIRIALNVDLMDSPEVAATLCSLFIYHKLSLDDLDEEQVNTILRKLEAIRKLDDHVIGEFLSKAAERFPVCVVSMFLNRLERDKSDSDRIYEPIPFHGLPFLVGVTTSNQYHDILRMIRDRTLNASSLTMMQVGELFKVASAGIHAEGIAVLMEWVTTGEKAKILAVGKIVSEASREFVFNQVDFVVKLLNKAYEAGEECLQRVSTNLFRSAISGMKSTKPGQPFPEDIAQYEKANEIAGRYPLGSTAYEFYQSLAQSAKRAIQDSHHEAEELNDSSQW